MRNLIKNGLLSLCVFATSQQLHALKGTVEVKVDGSAYTSWGTDIYGPVSGTSAQGITFGHTQVAKGSQCKTYIDYIKSNELYSSASLRIKGTYGLITTKSKIPWVKFAYISKCELILSQ